jgi:hypothetical protein
MTRHASRVEVDAAGFISAMSRDEESHHDGGNAKRRFG